MTIALVILSIVGMVVLVVVITLAHRRSRPSADVLHHTVLKRVVERHEKEQQNLGRE